MGPVEAGDLVQSGSIPQRGHMERFGFGPGEVVLVYSANGRMVAVIEQADEDCEVELGDGLHGERGTVNQGMVNAAARRRVRGR